jgi:diacylglycerol kinase (ATP)
VTLSKPVVVIVNPAAGGGKASKAMGRVDELLGRLGIPHEIRVSDSAEDLEEHARSAARQGAPIVAVLGGDGSAGAAANGLMGSDAALAVLPAGTGDDFAKTIGPGKLSLAVAALAEPHIQRIDVARVVTSEGQRHFVNVAGAGFDSYVNERANDMRTKLGGTATYVVALLATLRRFTPAEYRILVDDEAVDVRAMLAIVGNGVSYGGGMRVLPGASMRDGALDVCIVKELSIPAFLRAFPRVFRGTHTSHPNVRMLRGSVVKVDADRQVPVYADGERVGTLPAAFDVLPGALAAVVDPRAKAVR